MKKYILMASVAVVLMTQIADAGLFGRWRARRATRVGRPVAAAPARPRMTTPAPANVTPAPAPAPAQPPALAPIK